MHLTSGAHIGVMVIPAALALAQRGSWSGETLLKAIVGGYEMAVVLGSSVRCSGSCNPHFRPSGIVGAFGAAATGIVADDHLSPSAVASALGLAANMAAGLNEWPWAGGLEINTQMGTASRSGITSLDLARAGIHSSTTALEGKDGLLVAYNCGPQSIEHFQELLADSALGDGILGVKFKPVTGCNFIQTPVSVALKLSNKVVQQISSVARVLIVTTTAAKGYPGCDNLGPFDKVQQTKMSIQYSVSSALLFGCVDEVTYRQFDHESLQTLIQKCLIEPDTTYDQALSKGKQPSRVEITMNDGTQYQHSLPDVPWFNEKSVDHRFRKELRAAFEPDVIDSINLECHRMPKSESCDRLFDLLAAAKVV